MDENETIKEKLKRIGITCGCCGSDELIMRWRYVGCLDCGRWTWYLDPKEGFIPWSFANEK